MTTEKEQVQESFVNRYCVFYLFVYAVGFFGTIALFFVTSPEWGGAILLVLAAASVATGLGSFPLPLNPWPNNTEATKHYKRYVEGREKLRVLAFGAAAVCTLWGLLHLLDMYHAHPAWPPVALIGLMVLTWLIIRKYPGSHNLYKRDGYDDY